MKRKMSFRLYAGISLITIFMLSGVEAFAQAPVAFDSTRVEKYLVVVDNVGDTVAVFRKDYIKFFESLNINNVGEFTNLKIDGVTIGAADNGGLQRKSSTGSLHFGQNSQWVKLTEHAFGYDPAAGLSPADSGAGDSTLSNRESIKTFSGSTNEYAYYSVFPPYGYEAEFDSLAMLVSVNSTAGDSVGWGFDQLGIAADSSITNSYTTEVTKQFDLGTTANQIVLLLWRFGQDPEERWKQTERFMKYLFRLKRDTGISNNESAHIWLHGIWLHTKPKT